MLKNALNLGSEDKRAVLLCVVERLNTEEVTCTEQFVGLFIPDGKGEHATKTGECRFSPRQIGNEEYFGVGMSRKRPTVVFEFGAKILVVVYFTIEYYCIITACCRRLFVLAECAIKRASGGGHPSCFIAC